MLDGGIGIEPPLGFQAEPRIEIQPRRHPTMQIRWLSRLCRIGTLRDFGSGLPRRMEGWCCLYHPQEPSEKHLIQSCQKAM